MSGWKPTDCPGPPHCRACVDLSADFIVAVTAGDGRAHVPIKTTASRPVKARTTSWKKASVSTRRKK